MSRNALMSSSLITYLDSSPSALTFTMFFSMTNSASAGIGGRSMIGAVASIVPLSDAYLLVLSRLLSAS